MWYVIHTMAGKEKSCLQQCRQYVTPDDYSEMFIPEYILQKKIQKEWTDVRQTLFPGYLFVETEHIEKVMAALKRVRQYTRVLKDGELVSPITKEEQDFLQAAMDGDHVVHYSEGFIIGNQAVITKGPLKNLKGCIRSVDRHRRVAKLEVMLYGRPTPMEVGFGAFARVSEEQFRQIVQQNVNAQKQEGTPPGTVKVLKGAMEGMTGKFLYANVDADEWTVEMKLFGSESSEVIFQKEEIKIY